MAKVCIFNQLNPNPACIPEQRGYIGWEVLNPPCTWDGSSSVHSRLGTGVAVLVGDGSK